MFPMYQRLLQSVSRSPLLSNDRNFYRMLNAVFNRPDRNRIEEVGPNRACTEWLIRCGAQVKWKGSKKYHSDYNTLPNVKLDKYVIEEVNMDEAAVMDLGFEHFDGCEHVRKLRFYHCPYLEDSALEQIVRLKNSLEELEIGSCGDVTERGLAAVTELQLLKYLLLYDLPEVRDKMRCYNMLQKALPHCNIEYKDIAKAET